MYSWMGHDADSPTANITGLQITPTRTIYEMVVGPMNLTVTFLSPIEVSHCWLRSRMSTDCSATVGYTQPADWVRQSTPFSYVAVEATSRDGASHSIQLYSDITAVRT